MKTHSPSRTHTPPLTLSSSTSPSPAQSVDSLGGLDTRPGSRAGQTEISEDVYLAEGVYIACYSTSGPMFRIGIRRESTISFLRLDELLRSVEALKNQIESSDNISPFTMYSARPEYPEDELSFSTPCAAWRLISSIGQALSLIQQDGRDESWKPCPADLFSRIPQSAREER